MENAIILGSKCIGRSGTVWDRGHHTGTEQPALYDLEAGDDLQRRQSSVTDPLEVV